jgi:prepilin-type N-terminal cleavage/methylation domain-containing protein
MKLAPRPTARRGYTILEVIVVMAAILILGSFILPTLFGMRGDTRSKAGADMIRGRMNEARAKAMEDGVPYRLAVSSDKKRLRLAPDTYESTGVAPTTTDTNSTGPYIREDDLPDTVLADAMLDQNDQSTQDTAGWVRVATFLPDGTCKEDGVEIDIREPGVVPFIIRLRGLTGAVSVTRGAASGSSR